MQPTTKKIILIASGILALTGISVFIYYWNKKKKQQEQESSGGGQESEKETDGSSKETTTTKTKTKGGKKTTGKGEESNTGLKILSISVDKTQLPKYMQNAYECLKKIVKPRIKNHKIIFESPLSQTTINAIKTCLSTIKYKEELEHIDDMLKRGIVLENSLKESLLNTPLRETILNLKDIKSIKLDDLRIDEFGNRIYRDFTKPQKIQWRIFEIKIG